MKGKSFMYNKKDVVKVNIQADYETPEHAGASGTFQLFSVTVELDNGKEIDVTENFDQGDFYYEGSEVVKALDLNPDEVDIEFV